MLSPAEVEADRGAATGRLSDGSIAEVEVQTDGGRDGTLEVVDGRIRLVEPEGGGRWPVLRTGEGVAVYVNGDVVTRERVIRQGDEIRLEARETEPKRDLSVKVAGDGASARLIVTSQPGVVYEVPPQGPATELTVRGKPVQSSPPAPLSREAVETALREAGVVHGIDLDVLEHVPEGEDQVDVEIARATPPKLPQEGKLRIYFEIERQVDRDPEAQRVDHYERPEVSFVESGALLAEIIPPVPGEPGTSVVGQPISPPTPKEIRVRAGAGAQLQEGSRKVVATQAGRPMIRKGAIEVVPIYIVPGDVDVGRGNVSYQGEVVVRGNVCENTHVAAGGSVEIKGSVTEAEVVAAGEIRVAKSILNSKVRSGGDHSVAVQLRGKLQPVVRSLRSLREALGAVLQSLETRGKAMPGRIGPLVTQVIEMRHPSLPREVQALVALKDQVPEEYRSVRDAMHRLTEGLTGLGPTRLETPADIDSIVESAELALHTLKAGEDQVSDLIAGYIQNATVEASGSVIVLGTGCYNSKVYAGRGVEAPRGTVRGGEVSVVDGDVKVKCLGSVSGAVTVVKVAENRRVEAGEVYPNVTVNVGGQRHVFDARSGRVVVRQDSDGRIRVS